MLATKHSRPETKKKKKINLKRDGWWPKTAMSLLFRPVSRESLTYCCSRKQIDFQSSFEAKMFERDALHPRARRAQQKTQPATAQAISTTSATMRPIDRPVIWHTPVQRPLLSHTPASRAQEASGSKHWQAPPLQNSTQNSPLTTCIVVASHISIKIKSNRGELPPNMTTFAPVCIDALANFMQYIFNNVHK
jgi:hypothetical protein